jgi:hypothetical protein
VSLGPELGEQVIEKAGGYCDPIPHRTKKEMTSRPFAGMSRFCHEMATAESISLTEFAVTFVH